MGKTSLVNYLCRNRGIKSVRIECGAPFEDMLRESLSKVLKREEVERVEKKSAEAGIGATLARLFRADAKASIGSETKYSAYSASLATASAEALRVKGVTALSWTTSKTSKRKIISRRLRQISRT